MNFSKNEKVAPLYLTQEELDQFTTKVIKKEKELQEATLAIWEATSQSSETWHDNAPFDIARENAALLNMQYKAMIQQLQGVVVVKSNNVQDKVVFGTKIELEINLTTKKTFVIGWISDVAKWVISSVSPLGEAILWKKEWEESSFLVWNKKTNVKILKILQS